MYQIIQIQKISKRYKESPLFKDLSLTIDSKIKLALIGPNGAGKSTLLSILEKNCDYDEGKIHYKKNIRIQSVHQDPQLNREQSSLEWLTEIGTKLKIDKEEISASINKLNFPYLNEKIGNLSGGMKRRLVILGGILGNPDLVLLDEPTNHLDQEGVSWFEKNIDRSAFAWIAISHDREFLSNFPEKILEINPIFPQGYFLVDGNYGDYKKQKNDYLASLKNEIQSLKTKVKREDAWLKQGIKARGTRAQFRFDKAHELKSQLAKSSSLAHVNKPQINFNASNRKSKKLCELKEICIQFDNKLLVKNLSLVISRKSQVCIFGANGSGKSSLLRVIANLAKPKSGKCINAPDLKIVYFEQERETLDPNQTIKQILGNDGDYVSYQDHKIHVLSWMKRFNFKADQAQTPVSKLSGGEKARLMIARLILTPADLLILDEPTNDLDIDTLEIFEEALLEFTGAFILVSHDRYLCKKVCNQYLILENSGLTQLVSSLDQLQKKDVEENKDKKSKESRATQNTVKKKASLSYLEQKEYSKIEFKIAKEEKKLQELEKKLEGISYLENKEKFDITAKDIEQQKNIIETTYVRWEELESKRNQ